MARGLAVAVLVAAACLQGRVTASSSVVVFDCKNGDLGDLQKQMWCCSQKRIGCPVPQYSCDGVTPGPSARQRWCCTHKHLGCPAPPPTTTPRPTPTTTPRPTPTPTTRPDGGRRGHRRKPGTTTPLPPYDCDADFHIWDLAWGQSKREWCCDHFKKACETFQCKADPQNQDLWWPAKDKWCCEHGVCREPYDCAAGIEHWDLGWSKEKKNWCCKKDKRFCDDYDCLLDKRDWKNAWTEHKKKWCCENHRADGIRCLADGSDPVSTTSLPFDCNKDLEDWENRWPHKKQDFCCGTGGRTCSFNCNALSHQWSPAKHKYCCEKRLHCNVTTTALPYDCGDGPQDAQKWPRRKTEWCCTFRSQGCDALGYTHNCTDGQPDSWNDTKAAWCCALEQKGCIELEKKRSRKANAYLRNLAAGYQAAPARLAGPEGSRPLLPPLAAAGCLLGASLAALALRFSRMRPGNDGDSDALLPLEEATRAAAEAPTLEVA